MTKKYINVILLVGYFILISCILSLEATSIEPFKVRIILISMFLMEGYIIYLIFTTRRFIFPVLLIIINTFFIIFIYGATRGI